MTGIFWCLVWSLGFVGMAKLISVVFVMRCSRYPISSIPTITLTRFLLIPAMGDIALDMSQGLKICVRVF
jgi:hypothetical protein